jgi:sucrose-6-phosphate hydrolase SacC (GH32 family)
MNAFSRIHAGFLFPLVVAGCGTDSGPSPGAASTGGAGRGGAAAGGGTVGGPGGNAGAGVDASAGSGGTANGGTGGTGGAAGDGIDASAEDAPMPSADARDVAIESSKPDAADGGPLWGPDADFPYVITNYDEPYRGQVHFSAPMGWLNDANGMWFSGGLYHLSYQAYPYSLQGDAKHWGHATSPDMLHWTHWPIMLDPGVNVPGDAWSGSTVVDVDNTSGFKTGPNPVLVTIYTATTKGTCLAYSNDLGVTWQAYANNPVAIGGPTSDTRDPHVFWHAPTNRWVCAHYDAGTNIYTSTDLKNWTRVSHVNFGFECPDMYELPVDGDANRNKWVLQDASGTYLLGQFNGTTFTPDSNATHKMDVGPNFYAAQTFYRRNFPDGRVIQMPWMTGLDGATAPFNQSIGFPTELKLVTFPEGVRVARQPISEIATLYGASQHVGPTTVPAGTNVFAGTQSRVFDLEVVFDVAQTAARTITFRFANLTFSYDVAMATVFGHAAAPVGGRTKVRLIRDWGQYELFVNDGQVTHTATFAFTPSDGSVSVTGDGNVAIVSADFRALSRVWPGKAATTSTILDDKSAGVTYTGTWTQANEGRYFGGSCRVSGSSSASVQASFTGTRVEWYGLKNTDLGRADVYLDGVLAQSNIETYSPKRQNALLFTRGGLANGAHTIRVVANGQKSAASSGTALVHDYFIAYVDP